MRKIRKVNLRLFDAKSKANTQPYERIPHNILLVFQAACLAAIALNAKLAGEVLYSCVIEGFRPVYTFVSMTIYLNILEIMNNWASIKVYVKYYRANLFLTDVLTLGIFYLQVYILLKLQETNLLQFPEIINISLLSYEILFFMYIFWNSRVLQILKNEETHMDQKEKRIKDVKTSFAARYILAALTILLQFFPFYVRACGFVVFIILSICFWYYHNKLINILEAIIFSKELGK